MDTFRIADKIFTSRLIVGTGKYSSPAVMVQAHDASGAEMITVAARRAHHGQSPTKAGNGRTDGALAVAVLGEQELERGFEAVRPVGLAMPAARVLDIAKNRTLG